MEFDNSIDTITPKDQPILTIGGVGGLAIPSGTSAQAALSPNGTLRYDTDLNKMVVREGGVWKLAIGGGSAAPFDLGLATAITASLIFQ